MQEFTLFNFLNQNKRVSPELLDSLKYELDQHIYYYGSHFKLPKERLNPTTDIKKILREAYFLYQMTKNRVPDYSQKIILSNAYFSFNKELQKLNYNVFSPDWCLRDRQVLTSFKLHKRSNKIKDLFVKSDFINLLSPEFFIEIEEFKSELSRLLIQKKVSALFVPNDLSFFENFSIKVCKSIHIPSFVFLHGLPGRYNNIDDNRADYLIVWGDKIKEQYIKVGVNPDKIFTSGHPSYYAFEHKSLNFSLDNILIITKSMNGTPPCSNKTYLSDRGNLILYLYSIEKVLKNLGVRSVRFRPHPSENADWYYQFLNPDFYYLDQSSLSASLKLSSLVIGPTSTLLLESIFYGINYIVYEPSINNIDLMNYPLVPPFDGSDDNIPVAKTEEELEYIIKTKESINPVVFYNFINTPFDISFVKKLI